MSLGAFVFYNEHIRDKQRKWIGEQKRSSLMKLESDEEAKKESAQESTPMIESRASLAQARGERPKTVTWQ